MPPQLPKVKLKKEHKLLEKFVAADSETLLYFYRTFLPSVVKYVCKNGGNEEDSRDVFQEALLVLYKQAKAGKLYLTASLKTYTLSICRYQWLKSVRKNKRIEFFHEDFDLVDLDLDIIGHLEKAEKFRLFHSHLSKMNKNSQQILNLHLQKYTTEEIAEALGISKLYVKKRKYECKKELIESIKKDARYNELKYN